MRRIRFEDYQDECAELALLKEEIRSLREKIEEQERGISSVTSVLLDSLFRPLNKDVRVDDNSLNNLYIKFINLYYDYRRIYGETEIEDDIIMIQKDDEKLHDLKRSLDEKKGLYKSKRQQIIDNIYKVFYSDLGIQNSEGYILAAQFTDEMIEHIGKAKQKVKKHEK